MDLSDLVKRVDLRRAKAALARMPRALRPRAVPRAVPPAHPALFLRAVGFALLAMALGAVLLWSSTVQAQTPTVLVSNTGETSSGSQTLDTSTNAKRAQAFTTGANAAGYTLSSIGFDFASITDTTTAGAHMVMTLNEVSGDNPGTALCTLTDPTTFSGSGVQIFDAPTTDPCPTLEAGTTYFAVIERVETTASATISLHRTGSPDEDTGSAMGWSIENTFQTFASGSWGTTHSQSFRVAVRGYAANNPASGAPSISGVLEEDEVLTADTVGIADADVLGTLSYQWLADGTAISGATSSTYTLTATEVGDAISLTVTFTDGAGHSESLTSAATHNVVADGATRKLLWVGTLTPADAGLSYIGFVDTISGSLSPTSFIDGSTTHAFETIEYKAGFGLAIVVRPGPGAVEKVKWIIDAGGEFALFDAKHIDSTLGPPNVRSEWLSTFGDPGWSIGTETVVYLLEDLNNRATGAPSISGVLQQDEELTADTAGIADADGLGTLSYQWLADGTAISGATSSTYTLTATEVGDAISLTVTFTDDEGYSESLTSAATHEVVATGATRKLLWLGTLTPGDRGSGTIGVNPNSNQGSLSPISFTYGSDTHAFDQIDFGPVPTSGLFVIINPRPGADKWAHWIFDTGREWALADASEGNPPGFLPLSWAASLGDPNWMHRPGDRRLPAGGGQLPCHRRADDHRPAARGRGTDRRHLGHHGRQRDGRRGIHLPVGPRRRDDRVQHRLGLLHLHPRGRRRGQADQGEGHLHRRRRRGGRSAGKPADRIRGR